MYRTLTPLALLLALQVQAQSIGTVNTSPANLTTCTLVNFNITGSVPGSQGLTNFVPTLTGNTLTIELFTGPGGQPFPAQFALGPYPAGTYTIIVKLEYNNNFVDQETITRVIAQGVNPNAGTNGSATLCTSDANVPLISLLGGNPDPGGVWTDPNGTVVANGIFDPGVSLSGTYNYLISVLSPCISDDAQVTISYLPNNNPGLPGVVNVCSLGGGPNINLFLYLANNPDAGGTWAKPGGGAHNGTYVPGVDPVGVYTYTVPGLPPCGPPSSTVTVQAVPPMNAGTGTAAAVCSNAPPFDLSTFLTGSPDPNGDWYDPFDVIVGPLNYIITPPSSPTGTYKYVVYGSLCPNDTSFVPLSYIPPPCNPGFEEMTGNVASFEVMPNPTEGLVTIELELRSAVERQQLDVVDVHGAVVMTEVLSGGGTWYRKDLDLGSLAKGAYVLRITSPDGRAVKRVMVR
jgi:hypothetical protein